MANNSQPQSQDVSGRLVPIGDTRLFIVEQGQGYPLLVLHGGPGLDHTGFGDYLNQLADQFRLILVDQRSQVRSEMSPPKTWTLVRMARDVVSLASALGLERYAVLGHSFGALVALQYAVDFPDRSGQTIVSSGFPFAMQDYGTIEVEDRLSGVLQPVLVLVGRHDRTCSVEAAEVNARGISQAELVIFEHSGHMTFVEENERYLSAVRAFLGLHMG